MHKVARDPVRPWTGSSSRTTGGVYRSDDGGDSWQDIAPGLPTEFGFAMVIHPREPNTAFTFPISGAGERWPVDAKARVLTVDGGATRQQLGEGQPPDALTAVMRDAMCADDHPDVGLYFGGATARSGARPTRVGAGSRSTATCPT